MSTSLIAGACTALCFLFFYKNLFKKNVEAEINQSFNNVLRTDRHSSGWESIKNVFILPICILNDTRKQ